MFHVDIIDVIIVYAILYSASKDQSTSSGIIWQGLNRNRNVLPIDRNSSSKHCQWFLSPDVFSENCLEDWTMCFRDWLAMQIGVTHGEQYMLHMIPAMFEHGEMLLGALIVYFVVLTLTKVIIVIIASLSSKQATQQTLYIWLTKISKWSMTDVFVVALIVLFLRQTVLFCTWRPG